MKSYLAKSLHFIYPSLCLHCHTQTDYLFCRHCCPFFELIDPSTRCPYCFAENERNSACPSCIKAKRWQVQITSALEYVGPVTTFVNRLKNGRLFYLAKTAAALMTLQLANMGWPELDYLVPVPPRMGFGRADHAKLLAKALTHYLGKPAISIVRRTPGDLPQKYLTLEEQKTPFYLKKRAPIEEKTILIVDDLVDTGTTLRRTATALLEGFPRKIYALALASKIY